MTDRNTVAFNKCPKRKAILRQQRSYRGENVTYEDYIKGYKRSMRFLYHTGGQDSEKYSNMMDMIEQVAKQQWALLPQIKEK